MGFLVRRRQDASGPVPLGAPPDEPKPKGPLVALWEFLGSETWDDGTARERGCLMLFVEQGDVKVCLSDKDQELVAFLTASSFVEALTRVEGGLQSGKLDWRRSKASQAVRRGRRE